MTNREWLATLTNEELDFRYTGTSKNKAIEEAKSILGRVKEI